MSVSVGTAVVLVGIFVIVPAIAAVIGYGAWVGKPKHWDRAMYWTAFVVSAAASGFLLVYAQGMQTGVSSGRHSVQMGLFGLALLFFGVAGGCFVGIFTYERARGPTWRDVLPGRDQSTDNVESDHTSDETPVSQAVRDHAGWWALTFIAIIAIAALAMWMIAGNKWNVQDNTVASLICVAYFFVIGAGPYWMLYDWWVHDRKLTRKLWLFFVPGGFLWYYFEVFRPHKLTSHRNPSDL